MPWSQPICEVSGAYEGLGGEREMRRDRVGSSSRALYRVYLDLDNFDLLEEEGGGDQRLGCGGSSGSEGGVYERRGLTRRPKKSTERARGRRLAVEAPR